jgi:hypothetical protein
MYDFDEPLISSESGSALDWEGGQMTNLSKIVSANRGQESKKE